MLPRPSVLRMSSVNTPAPARLAATLLLIRDSANGLEVLMVARHHEIDFASGALVFPGGRLARGDHEAAAHCSGIDGLSEEQIALRVGALREAFEESGLLLARERGATSFVSGARVAQLGPRYRQSLDREAIGIATMLEAEDLVLACDALVYYAHWITPSYLPKRFDTHFFLAEAPAEQIAAHDGREMIDSEWLRPADALAHDRAGTRKIVTATRLNLQRLGRSRTVAEALAAARTQPVVTVLPEVVEGPQGRRLQIPPDAGYDVEQLELPPRAKISG